MTHVRTQIRAAVAIVLTDALPDFTVFKRRQYARNDDSLPFIDMRILNENVAYDTMGTMGGGVIQERVPSLFIRATIEASEETIDDDMDAAAVLIENAMFAAGNLGGLIKDMELIQTNFTDGAEGAKPIGELILRYDFAYRVDAGNVEIAKD